MPLFKKKQEKVEKAFDLPELPSFPEVQEIKEALKPKELANEAIPPLPAFPSILNYPQLVQAQQLQKPDIKRIEEIGPLIWQEPRAQEPLTRELTELTPLKSAPVYPSVLERVEERKERTEFRAREPIFIKIDKFSEALSNFESIKTKVQEIDDLLKRTKEIRQKEQEEFDAWEKEIIEIKEKIDSIDEKLFSKLE